MGFSRIQTQAFSIDETLAALRHPRSGGVTFYVGTVRREDGDEKVEHLDYEAFPEMAGPALEALRKSTVEKFRLVDAIVIHRTGRLKAGDPILLVALSGAHRSETFEAVAYFMDRLKEDIPIWKRESSGGSATWILGAQDERVKA